MTSFIVYRFQFLTEFNKHVIDDKDKYAAKMNFHYFDRILSIDSVCLPDPITNANKKCSLKLRKLALTSENQSVDSKVVSKKHSELSAKFVNNIITK